MLFQPYEEQIKINSSQRIALMNRELNVVISALDQLLQMLSASIIVVALVVTLLAINWLVALIVGVAIVLVYVVVMVGTKRPLQKLGLRKVEFTRQFIQALQEGLGGIRDVIIDGSQSFYIDLLKKSDKPLRQMSVKASFLIRFPRFVMEPIGIIVIALAAYLLVSQEGVTNSIPLLGAFALGAQRLLPKAQKIYESWAFINNAKGSFKKIIQQLECYQSFSMLQQPKSLGFKQSIQFSAVSHRYEDGREEVLKQINLEIRKGERIGLIGATGSGKSTLVDLMMGLLKPTSGQITIDGGDLHDYQDSSRLQAWRASIAHVPQTIYLADSSIAENIAFGSPRDQIDMCRVRQSAKQAHIAEFIECQPDSYDGLVGERGVRLSGGQRQRIGIARAIYKQTQILVFDEATSALDNATEESIMSTIESLSDDITMVMIAHRLTSVMFCDRLVRLVDGRIDAIGSPNDLLA
jgi:ATP-binding cassette subfamily B protein